MSLKRLSRTHYYCQSWTVPRSVGLLPTQPLERRPGRRRGTKPKILFRIFVGAMCLHYFSGRMTLPPPYKHRHERGNNFGCRPCLLVWPAATPLGLRLDVLRLDFFLLLGNKVQRFLRKATVDAKISSCAHTMITFFMHCNSMRSSQLFRN